MLFNEGADYAAAVCESLSGDLLVQGVGFEASTVDPRDQVGLNESRRLQRRRVTTPVTPAKSTNEALATAADHPGGAL